MGNTIQLRRTWLFWLFAGILSWALLPAMLIGVSFLFAGNVAGSLIIVALTLPFLIAAWGLSRGAREYTIDMELHRHYPGRSSHQIRQWPPHSKLEDVHALQIVPAQQLKLLGTPVRWPYPTYELNFVFRDGSRHTLLNHSEKFGIAESASLIADRLGIPVWRTRINSDRPPSLDERLPLDASLW